MGFSRASAGVALVLVAAFGLSGCGRKGPLDPPPGDGPVPAPQAQAAPGGSAFGNGTLLGGSSQAKPNTPPPNGYDSQGNRVTTVPSSKTFILDPLLQ